MPPEAQVPTLAPVVSNGDINIPKHFKAPDSWDRSPLMKLISSSPDRACAACGYSNDLSQIFANPVDVLCPSKSACQRQHEKGVKEGCFLCTIVFALLDIIDDLDLDHGTQCTEQSVATTLSAISGSFVIKCGQHCSKPKAWQVFIPEPAPPGLSGIPSLSLLHGSSSPQALKFLKKQIKTCLKSHTRCQVLESDYTPTRLLYIAKDGKIRLRFHSDIPKGAKYTALSHRWARGSTESCLTTRSNIEDRKNNIPWDELPQLFHDTVSLTLGLGLSYVWIDSFCIVQDDEDDWKREAASIMPIFNNALITIAALYADSSAATMFPRSTDLQHKFLTVQHGQKNHQLYARELLTDSPGVIYHANSLGTCDRHHSGSITRLAPLLRRAWAFQDCLVSSRVVYVGAQEITFECRAGITCECGLHRFDAASGARHALAKSQRPLSFTSRIFSKPTVPDNWQDFVEQYSRLELNSEEDRLLALGGYAQQHLQACPGQQYLAGLWSGDLTQQLLWTTNPQKPRYSTQSNCVAPSWSWASASSPIIFPWQRHNTTRTTFVVRQTSCRSTDGTPFGAAIEAWLQLKGRLAEARLSYEYDNIHKREVKSHQRPSKISVQRSDGYVFHKVYLDRLPGPRPRKPNEPNETHSPCSSPGDSQLDVSSIDKGTNRHSEAVYLFKVLEVEPTEGNGHKTEVHMILTRSSQSGIPARLKSSSLRVYRRIGMATSSTVSSEHIIEEGTISEKRRPSIKARRSSSAVFTEGLSKMLSFNDSGARHTEIVLC